MGDTSLWTILFVSFPEILFTVIITLAAAGYRHVLNFKTRENFFRLMLTVTCMVALAQTMRIIIPNNTLAFLIDTAFFFGIILGVYRCRIVPCLMGLLLAGAVIIISEAVFLSIILKVFDITLPQIRGNALMWILVSIPDRLCQITAILILCKVRKIRITGENIFTRDWSSFILYCLLVLVSMFTIESGFKSVNSDFMTILRLVLNIGIAVVFLSWMIINMFNLRKKIQINENMHDVELHHVKQLLEEGRVNYAIELIDITLNERGYYSNGPRPNSGGLEQ